MQKILYYGSSGHIHSGACQWMHRLANRMRDYGYETKAILPNDRGISAWYETENIDVEHMWSEPVRLRRSLLGQIWYFILVIITTVQLSLLIYQEEIDIVHVNDVRYLPGLLAGAITSATTVCHVRVCFESRFRRVIFGGIVSLFSDRIICVSNQTAEMMFESVGFGGDQIRVIHDSLPSPDRFDELPSGDSFRDEFEIENDSFLLVSVSKLVRNKGQDRLLSAADELKDDIKVAIVGGTVEGHEEYAEELEQAVEYNSDVRLTGFYDKLPEVLGAADALVHTPRHEDPFPGVVLEGMICGVPVIGSRSGGIPEQINDGETGYLIPKEGGESRLVDQIEKLASDEELRDRLGENGRRRAFERFDTDAYFDRINDEYESLLR